MSSISKHLERYPQARTTTLIILQTKAEKTKQLKDEIKAEKRRKRLSWVSWLWRSG